MNRIKKSSLGLSLLLNVIICFGLLLVFRPCYETSDDMFMNEFASGIFGKQENHLVFINYILSSILLVFYKVVPFLNWYAIFQYLSVFTSFVVITYIFIKTKGDAVGIGLSAIIITAFGYQGYILPQFSKTAGFLILAGALLVFFTFECGEMAWQKVLLGVLLMVVGAMFRESMFLLGLLMMFPIGVIKFLWAFATDKFKCLKKYVIICVVFVGTLACVKMAYVYHDYQYECNAEWAEYIEWDQNLVKLIDGFFPYYEDDRELYEELGISEADLRYYEEWNIADTEQLSTETLARLVEAKDAYWISPRVKLLTFWSVFPMAFTGISVFPYCVVIFAVLLLVSKKRSYWAYVLEIGALFVSYLIMYIRGRVLFNRIDVVVWLGAILACVYLCEMADEGSEIHKRRNGILLTIMLGCVGLHVCIINTSALRFIYDSQFEEDIRARQEVISADKEHLYLCTANILGTGVLNNPFYVGKEGELSNYYVLGSWTVNTPITNQVLENYGVSNPYRDIIDNEKVYIIDIKNPELTEQYIQENYNENAYMELSHEAGSYNVYRVVTK